MNALLVAVLNLQQINKFIENMNRALITNW